VRPCLCRARRSSHRRFAPFLGLILLLGALPAAAIPPDHPITNVARVSYELGAEAFSLTASHTLRTDPNAGNSPPADIVLDNGTVVAASPGLRVGGLAARDPDPDDALVFSVDDPRFEIRDEALWLRPDVALGLGDSVTVRITVTDEEQASYREAFEIRATPPAMAGEPTRSLLTLWRVAADAGAAVLDRNLGPGYCETPAGLRVEALLPRRAGDAVELPADVALAPAAVLGRGDALLLRLLDGDRNRDPARSEQVRVTVTAVGGDRETLRLLETGPDSGEFLGWVATGADTPEPGDCRLSAPAGARAEARYQDPLDDGDRSDAALILDPGLRVFSAVSGAALDGARVTLLDADSGEAAARVFGDDGVSAFPAAVTVGASATDGAGTRYDFPSGTVRFPWVAPGRYRLLVEAPAYRFPSDAGLDELAALPAGPFRLGEGFRGEAFEVDGSGLVLLDLPLDPLATDLFLTKTAGQEQVAIGDLLQYQVTLRASADADAVARLAVIDELPPGFRYRSGSARLDGLPLPDPLIEGNGRRLRFDIAGIGAGAERRLSYVTEVGAGAGLGRARNRARAEGEGVRESNVAFADVAVREDLLRSSAIVTGRVTVGGCDAEARGLAGVRLWLEDGTYVVTDDAGRYHLEGLRPGSHVLKLDRGTLPGGFEPLACEDHSRFAGAADSRFVDLQPGTLWRADFAVTPAPPPRGELRARLDSRRTADGAAYRLRFGTDRVALSGVRAMVMLPAGARLDDASLSIDEAPLPLAEDHDAGGPRARLSDGTLVLELPDRDGAWEHEVAFAVTLAGDDPLLEARAVVMGRDPRDDPVRTPVAENRLNLHWPEDLTAIASRVEGAGARGGAFEPSARSLSSSGKPVAVRLTGVRPEDGTAAIELPPVEPPPLPAFDGAWMASQPLERRLLWPHPELNPRIPAVAVAATHRKGERPMLLVNGQLANPLTFVGAQADPRRPLLLSRWDNVAIRPGDNLIEVRYLDAQDRELDRQSTRVHFSGPPRRAELAPEASRLVADGVTTPIVAVRLFDEAGHPARPGTAGEFRIEQPYRLQDPGRQLTPVAGAHSQQAADRYLVRHDGLAYLQLEPTSEAGEVVLRFPFDRLREQVVRARLVPQVRDWVLVGLAEGTLGAAALDATDPADRPLDDRAAAGGRAAFYARGPVAEDWIITAAFDSDRPRQERLGRQLDPGQFYTLYGDGSEQRFDGDSQSGLYLKAEHGTSSTLLGDYRVELGDSEFTRYQRDLNGVRSAHFGSRLRAEAFAAETDQAFSRELIPGDGTSGEYRLGNADLVINSERISIVTRDRLQPERELSRTALVRFIDYSIDYVRGALIFRQPVAGQDMDFNPQFIEAEYEVVGSAAESGVVAGTRVGLRLDEDDGEVAVTWVEDDTPGAGGRLRGVDLNWNLDRDTRLLGEFARSESQDADADAYRLALEHQGRALAGRVYLREQGAGFGLGQQLALTAGTRQFGVDGEWRLTDALSLRSDVHQQEVLGAAGRRQVVDARIDRRLGTGRLATGLRGIRERAADGTERENVQLTAGLGRGFYDDRLQLRSDLELGLGDGGSADTPSRAVLGAELDVGRGVRLLGEQEFGWTEQRRTQDSRFGFESRPWPGAELSSMLGRQQTENGARLFATSGLRQQWRLSERWAVDFGGDRVQTLADGPLAEDPANRQFNPAVAPATGSFDQDFTALFAGVGYRRQQWDANLRLELHQGDQSDKWNLLAGASEQLVSGRVLSASLSLLDERGADGSRRHRSDLRWGLALRPEHNPWTVLNRLDLNVERRQDAAFDLENHKLVNNFNANRRFGAGQLSLQLGVKLALDRIDGERYRGVTGLLGGEYRHDLSRRWDLGLRASALMSEGSATGRYSAGVSLGVSLARNTWVSLGYNLVGFTDDDFVAAEDSAQGIYLKLRMKFDEGLIDRFTGYVDGGGREASQRLLAGTGG